MITTGSQGEPMSSLTRIAMDDHKQIKLEEGDTVILSSRFIPGNEKTISDLINHLYRRGAEVIHEKVSEVHVSGHASQEELKLLHNLVRPRYFVPVHGEYRHLVKHSQLAQKLGLPKERCILAVNGDVIAFSNGEGCIVDRVETGRVFVDGKGVGDVGNVVLKDRKHLSQDGMVVVIIAIDQATGEIIYGPDIVSRGFVFEDESQQYLDEAKKVVAGHPCAEERRGTCRLERGQTGGAPGSAPILQQDHRTKAGDTAPHPGDVGAMRNHHPELLP